MIGKERSLLDYSFGIDLGGTNIGVGLVDSGYNLIRQGSIKTNAPRPAEALCDDITALCKELAQEEGVPLSRVSWAGIGSPGIVWDGVVYDAANLGLHNAPLQQLLSHRLELPVYVENDANTAAYGEYIAGAGKGCYSLVAVTIGTGIGSGFILEGKISRGFNGAAFELGHTQLHQNGRPCRCGRLGCVEQYCSATGLTHSTRLAMEENPSSHMWRLCDGRLEKASARTAFQAMRAGDASATLVVHTFLQDLAQAISMVVCLLQPEIVCLGGGVAQEGDAILDPLREMVIAQTLPGRDGLRSSIIAATLGNNAGIIGAAMIGQEA